MHARARRGVTAVLGVCAVVSVGLSACGDGSDPVATGPGTEAASTTPPPASEPPGPASTTEPAPPAGASPVDGLTAAQLRTVVETPPSGAPAARRGTGPVADRVTVDGRTVWRVVIPGTYDLLSSRIVVTVGDAEIGEGIVAPDLTALVAVVADPAALVAGAPVAYRWGAGAPVSAGRLEVAR